VATYRIEGGGSTAIVDPSRGGKIVSLIGPDGREWLAQPFAPSHPPYRGSVQFTASDPAGWDECAPSIDACEIGGGRIPDHGDLWTKRWAVVSASDDSLELSVQGSSLDFRLIRRISPTSAGLRLDYTATTAGPPIPFLWAAHPQFVSPRGSVLELPDPATSVVDVLDPSQPVLAWSNDLATTDTLPDRGCRKLYVHPGTQIDSATLRHPDGVSLTMSWTNCPFVGLWYDNGAFAREPVIAIEPSLGYRDSLAWAVVHGHAPTLGPDHPLEWSVEIAIDAAT
jgi:galactose mutarotase-like enzyme